MRTHCMRRSSRFSQRPAGRTGRYASRLPHVEGLESRVVLSIEIDGNFSDWASVASHADPVDDQHDTDHNGQGDVPDYVNHPDVDLLEYKVAHDRDALYVY